jgi:hypothetical protein
MATLTIVSFALTGLSVDFLSNPGVFALIAILFALTWFYSAIRPDPRLKIAAEAFCQVLLILLFGILLTYAAAAASANFPYSDPHLERISRVIGFDRRAYLAFFAAHPSLGSILSFAYVMLLPQFAAVPLLLFFAECASRLHVWLLAVGIALLATSAISVVLPAVDAFVYSDLELQIPPGVYTAVPTLETVRGGTFRLVRLDNLEALVTFPSFHTAGALLFVWALWPLGNLRYGSVALNAALIAATPVDGAHHFADLIGGAAVALVSLMISSRLCRRIATDEAAGRSPLRVGEPRTRIARG